MNPVKYLALGNVPAAVCSPLTLNTEPITVTGVSHTTTIVSADTFASESEGEIEIEVDILENERIGFTWACYAITTDANDSPYIVYQVDVDTNDADSEIEVEYLCGIEDLDIAANLPDVSCKSVIGSFFNQFNLSFTVNEASKTVEVSFADNFYSSPINSYTIDDIVRQFIAFTVHLVRLRE